MPQPRLVPVFRGPFLGLCTTLTPRELGQSQAEKARNVLFSEGSVQVRPPLRILPFAITGADIVSDGITFGRVMSLLEWERPNGETVIFRHVRDAVGSKIKVGENTLFQTTNEEANLKGATFVPMIGRVYIALQDGPMLKSEGTPSTTLLAGMPVVPVPTGDVNVDPVQYSTVDGQGTLLLPGHRIEVGASFYDSVHDVEGNLTTHLIQTVSSDTPKVLRVKINAASILSITPQRRVTHLRIYLKDTDSDRRFILAAELAVDAADTNVFAFSGNSETGPFGPSKNGIATNVTVACPYFGRLFYARRNEGQSLYYTGLNPLDAPGGSSRPDHADGVDFVALDDDGGQITGLCEYAGQLVIAKERSIWILSGSIAGHTNETVATGAGPAPSNFTLYRTKSAVGCANIHGPNGTVVAGSPPRVYFPSQLGFYEFDGVVERQVSDWIRPTYDECVRLLTLGPDELQPCWTFANDSLQRILYMCPATVLTSLQAAQGQRDRPQVLAYHYGTLRPDGVGAWSILDHLPGTITAVASSISRARWLAATLDAALTESLIQGIADDDVSAEPMPEFEFATGRLVPYEGLRCQVYAVKWLHERTAAVGQVLLGFEVDGVEVFEAFNFQAGVHTYQRVWRQGEAVRLLFKSQPQSTWSKGLRIVGWGIDAELVGQR